MEEEMNRHRIAAIEESGNLNLPSTMTQIENETQYNWAINRVDELLPLVNDETPEDDPNCIELIAISNLIIAYEDIHYPINKS